MKPGHTHARPTSPVSRITQVTPHNGGLLQKSTRRSVVEACRLDQFQCNRDKRCISRQSVCDDLVDCSDRSDEKDCALRCAADEFFCDDLCYPAFFTCDGFVDCTDGSDEDPANCLITSQPLEDGDADNEGHGGQSNGQSQNNGGSENGDGQTGSGVNGNSDSSSNTGTNGTNGYQNTTSYQGNNGTNLQDGDSHGNNSGSHSSGRGNGDQGNGDQGNGGQGNGGQGNGGQGNGGQSNGGQGNRGQGNGGQGNGGQGNGDVMYDGGAYGKGLHNLSDYDQLWLRFNLTVKNETRLPCPCFVFGRQLVGRSSASSFNVSVPSIAFLSVFTFIVVLGMTAHIL